jgi:hypothetical protein
MDVFCPSCGYNLHGIPEIRCPECGFGFDRAAVEAIALHEFERRFATYGGIIARSAFAAAFALPGTLRAMGVAGDGYALLVFAGFLAALLVKRRFGRFRISGIIDWAPNTAMFVLAILAVAPILLAAPAVGSIVSGACLLDAALVWACGSGGLAFADRTLPAGGARRLSMYQAGAAIALFVAVAMLILSWV